MMVCIKKDKIFAQQVIFMLKEFLLQDGDLPIPVKISESEYSIRRVVLGVHGLGGNAMDEIQVSLAEEMELFDSVVYRFDFPVHGESPLESEDFTLENCRRSLMAVARHAKETYPQVEDLCIFATGFGAYITLICLEDMLDLPGNIRLVLQTPSVRMDQTLLAMARTTLATYRAMGHLSFRRRRPLDVSFEFYEDLLQHVAMITYPIPMLILQGEEDSYINRDDIQNFTRINDQSKLVIIPGASHRFLEPGAWDMVLDLTRDWFEFEQVLLSDWS